MSDVRWLLVRNLMSHTYDASRALQVYESLPGFLHAFRELQQALQREIGLK